MARTKSLYPLISVLTLIYALLVIFLFSFKHYPLDDDWSYIKAAETYHHTGKLHLTPWTAMNLVFQIWWGTCFTQLLGYSIEALRVSTLTISFVGLIFIYLLLQELRQDPYTSLGMILLILFNPFSFPLNFTFFTDHFFTSLLFISTYCFYKSFKDKNDLLLLFSSLIASLAVLVRQNGILIPLAACIYLLITEKSARILTKKGFLILFPPIATFAIFTYWLNAIHGIPAEYAKQMNLLFETLRKPHLLIIKLVWRPFLILEFLGFCLLPLSISLLPRPKDLFSKRSHSLLLLFCLAGTTFYLLFEHIGLFSSVDLWIKGFHFAYISEYGFRGHLNLLFFFYRIADFAAIVSIIYLLNLLIKGRKSMITSFAAPSPEFLILLIAAAQLLFLLITPYKFSRYYLTLIPFFLFLTLESTRYLKIQKKIFIPLLTSYALFSFAITQDFLNWNQTKWQTAQQLLNRGIPLQEISAGFAWDAWQTCSYSLEHPYHITTLKGDIPWWFEKLTPALNPHYLISNSPIPTGFEFFNYFDNERYSVIEAVNYFSLFYLKNMKIYILEREPSPHYLTPGISSYDFIHNFKGAHFHPLSVGNSNPFSVSIGDARYAAWLQHAPSRVTFTVPLPTGRCRLRAALSVMPTCWDKSGDGVLCKILIDDILLENLFHTTGTIGLEERRTFFKPKTFFFEPRTYFLQYLDPKHNAQDRRWHDLSLDLSAFAGKVVNITFEVQGGPLQDTQYDEVLWAQPTIEAY